MINMSYFMCEKDIWQEAARLLVINAAVCISCWAFIFNYGLEYVGGPWGSICRLEAQGGNIGYLRSKVR